VKVCRRDLRSTTRASRAGERPWGRNRRSEKRRERDDEGGRAGSTHGALGAYAAPLRRDRAPAAGTEDSRRPPSVLGPEVRRLQQIASLRQLGLSLQEIDECLESPVYSLPRVLQIQIRRIQDEIEARERLRRLLEELLRRVERAEAPSVQELTRTIEATMSMERYYTPEQLEQLALRREKVGEERIREVQQEWAELFAAYERAMRSGLDPASEQVLALARRSEALIGEFTGGDPGIESSLGRMYREEGGENVLARHGMHTAPELWDYMAQARRALDAWRS